MNITVGDVRKVVATVRAQAEAGDNEAAHAIEDGLHQSVLRAIAEGRCADPAACAAAALETRRIEFARWYA